ncbi:GTP 3',8-cyclase MoaA [Sanguibacter sp. 25GB23B1]|uniref:GTP 3',8-cyclase MoaA n=1 Tax=unclassified Sanguibacter TaxID=2645534 RepID=UPI0032AF5B7F
MSTVALGLPTVRSRPTGPSSPPNDADHRLSPGQRPHTDALVDRFGRVARDLRVSITEKCSLRCTYCMPAEGLPTIARSSLLAPDEIARLVRVAVHRLGIEEVRFTGGEPLMRHDLVEILRLAREAAPGVPFSMTTNAIGLDKRVASLVAAGLTRVNISLDTVDRLHFAELTRRDRLPDVLAGIAAAYDAGLTPLKINAVLMPETLAGAVDLLTWAVEHDCRLRFIEQMPLDADQRWTRESLVSADDLLGVLSERFALTPVGRDDASSPAEEWAVDGGPATVGIIASVTRSFCGDCDRTRLTAEGTLRSCLFSSEETDLRSLLREGASDDDLVHAWQSTMWAKPFAHGIDAPEGEHPTAALAATEAFARSNRSMGAIGG